MLQGKKAFITGGTRGIGKAIAEAFVKNGAHVIIAGTSYEHAESATGFLKTLAVSSDQRIDYKLLDAAHFTGAQKCLAEVLSIFGALDILVNCAGITRDQLLLRMSEKDWDDVIDVNLKSVFNVCHAALPGMLKARRGKIINVSSVIGLVGNAGQTNYSASKFGMIGFTRSLALEVGKRGVAVNAIAPGFIDTDMTASLTEEQKKRFLENIPMQRFGKPEDVAQAALFLASTMSDYITGQVITVDGGMLA